MTAFLTIPYPVAEAQIVATNLALETEFSSGATLATGDIRRVGTLIYEYIGAPGAVTINPRVLGQTVWVALGPANRYRPFDLQVNEDRESVISTVATNADEITYTLSIAGRIQAISFHNVRAATIRVVATAVGPGVIYDQTRTLFDLANYTNSWWDYLNLPIVPATEVTFAELNVPAGAQIVVTISNPGNTAQVGAIVMGYRQDLGATLVGASWAIESYSIREFDGYKRTLIRFNPGEIVTCDIKCPAGAQRAIRQTIRNVDGVAALWELSDSNPEFTIYGVLDDFTMTAETRDHSFINLRIVGV